MGRLVNLGLRACPLQLYRFSGRSPLQGAYLGCLATFTEHKSASSTLVYPCD